MNMTATNSYTKRELSLDGSLGKIYAQAFIPQKEGSLPAVILSHGYNSSHSDLLDYAEALAAYGYVTLAYDFCGGSTRSMSEGSSTDMSLKTEIADLRAAVSAVKAMECTDNSKIYLFGESQGGCVSALAAGETPEEFAGLALMYPALCIPDDWKDRRNGGMPETMELMGMTVSRKFAEELPDYDIYEHIAKFSKPVLLLHGDADGLVNLSYSQRAQQAYPNAQLAVYSGEGHGFSPRVRAIALARIHHFLTENQ